MNGAFFIQKSHLEPFGDGAIWLNMNIIKIDVARLAKKYVKQGTEVEYDTIVLKLLTKYSKEGGMFEWIK